jgi:hypothetical protein
MKRILNIKNLVFLLYVSLSLLTFLNHTPWRDEAQAWLIARDSGDLFSMFSQIRYEGTPPLWHLILFPLAKLGLPYISMGIVHILLNWLLVYLIIYKAPFNLLQKILIIFGYLVFYEYAIIARSYVLTILLMLLIANYYKDLIKKKYLILFLISLLALTNAFGAVIAFVMFLGYFYLLLQNRQSKKSYFIYFITGGALSLFLYSFLPPSDVATQIYSNPTIFSSQTLMTFGRYILQSFSGNYDLKILNDVSILGSSFDMTLLIVGFLVWVATLLTIIRSKKAFVFVIVSQLALMTFMVYKDITNIRHIGMIFGVYLFGLWISKDKEETIFKRLEFLSNKYVYQIASIIVFIFFVIQVFLSQTVFQQTYNVAFSNSKVTAQYIKSNLMTDYAVFAGYHNYAMSAISPYFEKPFIYSLEHRRVISFEYWNKEYADNIGISTDEMYSRVYKYCQENVGKKCYLILDKSVEELKDTTKYKIVFTSNDAFVRDEDYIIYLVLNIQNL